MLRTRLFINLIPFVLILVAMGIYAMVLFTHLAKTVETTLDENYRGSMAVQSMSVALAQMETGLRLATRGEQASGADFFNQNASVFENGVGIHSTNTAFKDAVLVDQLREGYEEYKNAGVALLALDDRRQRRQFLEQEITPRTIAIEMLLEQARKTHQKNILATSETVRQTNRHITQLMIIGIGVALLIAGYAWFVASRTILRPIQLVTRATREIEKGNLDQTVPIVSRDELGELASAFNKMAAQLKIYQQSTSEKIMRLHRTMESALASFPDPIFVLDREGRIELRNPAARMLGARLDLKDSLPDRLSTTANRVLSTGEDFLPQSFKHVISLRLNGDERAYLPRIHTMRGDDDKPVGVAVVLHDVTRFRLMDDVKSNLVATVSHELKTPLTSIRMVLHLLLERTLGPLTSRQTEMLEMARKDSERLLRILNDLLDLARMEAGDSQLHRENVSPGELLKSIAEEVQPLINAQGMKLSLFTSPGLPPVAVDRQRMSLVFHNLITNAVKFSPPGGEIELHAAQTNGSVCFSVTDHGPGVPQSYQARIFDRFFRAPGHKKTGAGLGLSIAREIVNAHGGRMGVRSTEGQGSEFYVVLTAEGRKAHES
jgi:NtrC-family two-component system sensor histidine kinase KinB